jgi:phospholipase A1/A2
MAFNLKTCRHNLNLLKAHEGNRNRILFFVLTWIAFIFIFVSSAYSQSDDSKPGLYFLPHKLNYFILNGLPPNKNAQMKYQISAKYQVVEFSDYHLYFSYTQKSFWDIGKKSRPFEESNYNPEIFISHPIDRSFDLKGFNRDLVWHDITLGLLEHESNGLAGPDSRSWNRSYLASSFGIESKKALEQTEALIQYRFLLSIKLWIAYGQRDENRYLESIGRGHEDFSDYSGRGEISASLRDILFPKNQIDFKTRIFNAWNRESYEIGYHQNIPKTNFYLYAQYWYGYGESLTRFAELDRRFKIGLSFFH